MEKKNNTKKWDSNTQNWCRHCWRFVPNVLASVWIMWRWLLLSLAYACFSRFSLLIMDNGVSKSIQYANLLLCDAADFDSLQISSICWRWYSNGNRFTVKSKCIHIHDFCKNKPVEGGLQLQNSLLCIIFSCDIFDDPETEKPTRWWLGWQLAIFIYSVRIGHAMSLVIIQFYNFKWLINNE